MNAVRLLGFGVAAVGILIVIVGLESAHVPLARFTELLTADLAHDTMLYITGGLAAITAGTVLAVFQPQ